MFSGLVSFVSENTVTDVFPENVSILEDRFSMILRITSLVSLILLLTDFSTFSVISEKCLSEKPSTFSVLRLATSGSTSVLVGECLLAFLLDDLSGILVLLYCLRLENSTWEFLLSNEEKLDFERFLEKQQRIKKATVLQSYQLKSIPK